MGERWRDVGRGKRVLWGWGWLNGTGPDRGQGGTTSVEFTHSELLSEPLTMGDRLHFKGL